MTAARRLVLVVAADLVWFCNFLCVWQMANTIWGVGGCLVKPATGRPCIPALPGNSRQPGDASTQVAFLLYVVLSSN